MNPDELVSMLFADEESGQEKAMSLANALRGEQQMGMLGLLSGDKVLSNVGNSLLQGAGRKEAAIGEVAGQRRQGVLQRALAAQQAKSGMEHLGAQQAGQMEQTKFKAGEDWRQLMAQLGQKDAHDKAAREMAERKQAADASDGLRKELNNSPVTKQFQDVSASYGKINSVAKAHPSPAGDMALIFSFMKMMDPGSSVREGEYANASNTTGVPGQVLNAYNKAIDGQLLSGGQRNDFVTQAQRMYQTHADQYGQLAGKYKEHAARRGVPIEDVAFIDLGQSAQPEQPPQTGGFTPEKQARLQQLREKQKAGLLK